MDSLTWRIRARISAFLDLILTIATLLVVIFAAISGEDDDTWVSQQSWVMCLLIGGLAVCSSIQMWGTFRILNGTDVLTDLSVALNAVQAWHTVTLIYLIAQLIFIVLTRTYSSLIMACTYLIRGVFFYVMRAFKQELRQRLRIIQVPFPIVTTDLGLNT